ncbi:Sporozoite surface protein [Thalictrum thalictroides]|uniref:Sporozoite surface protein n=1 Tax=Thalictrum thalictroides TaxID=46969 RepID=A0A7J6WJE7_THATH|nr:Sporozoite surface protein [Thalictrum thalictroides]
MKKTGNLFEEEDNEKSGGVEAPKEATLSQHPKTFKEEIYRLKGAPVTYWVAWAARKMMVEIINGNHEESYKLCRGVENTSISSKWFTVAAYRAAYKRYIYPIADTDDWNKVEPGLEVLPPPIQAQPGRPKTMRIRDDEEDVAKRTRICSKCKEAGHNARTCARNITKKARRDEMLGIDTQDEMTQPTQPTEPTQATQPTQASTSTSRGGGRGTQPTQPSQAHQHLENVGGRSGVNGGQNGGDDGGVRLRSGMRLRGGRGRTGGRFNWWLGGEGM